MASLSAIPPVIDVVTGTDWPAVISSIVTGVAAVVGIGGTAYLARRVSNDSKKSLEVASNDAKSDRKAASDDLQASLKAAAEQLATSINADDRRARVAEKRRIYASVLAVMQQVMAAATAYRVARSGNNAEERKAAASRQTKSQEDMFQAIGELMLIAPHEVAGNAVALQNTLVQFMVASHAGEPFGGPEPRAVGGVRDALLRSMRIDLGEPVGSADDAPPVQGQAAPSCDDY
jgi:hypothetical protein